MESVKTSILFKISILFFVIVLIKIIIYFITKIE